MKVLHIITGLNTGGAESMLFRLISATDRVASSVEVISLTDSGAIGEKISALGVSVRTLGMRRDLPNLLLVVRLAKWLRCMRVDVIQTWMPHADLIGGVAAKLAGDLPVVWGIRFSNLDPQGIKRRTIWTVRLCAYLSLHLPTRIICCSEAACHVHTKLGYANKKMIVIPNGFNLSLFK
nr:hypothetical protein [Rhodospirillales bacterium]